jgi:eukaryotic-like serine/threonine-protein kinase
MDEEEQFLLPIGSIIRDPLGDAYVVEAWLGQGGFGAVYLVREQHGQQVFALKEEIHPNRFRRARFTVEADILRRLEHPALPRVYRVFEDVQRQRSYMRMEYIAGRNLDALRREQPEKRFSVSRTFELLEPIVDALIYLHQQNPPIVHRDVKPANIIVPPDHAGAVLVDFGLAKEYVEDRTTNDVRPATPGYAAPEQYDGGTTPRADLYSLGATFYAMLTGKIPPHALRRAINKGADLLQPPRELAPEIPEGVAEAITRAMAIHSEDRFETVEQFWQAMHSQTAEQPEQQARAHVLAAPLASGEQQPLEASQAPVPRKRGTSRIRGSSVLAMLALILLLAVVGGGAALVSFHILSAPGVVQSSTPTLAASPTAPPAFCKGTASVTPAATPAPGSPAYPVLFSSYAGTVYDSFTKERTALCLMNIQQSGNNIRGTFQGLGLAGPFQGTVTTDNQLSFTVPLYSGKEMLVCTGTIKVAGDLVGAFQVFDQQKNFTGEYGIWGASVYVG